MSAPLVPEDPQNLGYDVLIGEIGTRTHYIHCVMAESKEPMSTTEIGNRAKRLAIANGYPVKPNTFSSSTTGSHMASMRDKPGRGYAEEVEKGLWQLTVKARNRIAEVIGEPDDDQFTNAELPLPEEVVDTPELTEGAIRTINVNAYERNAEARARCIAHHGCSCCICGFDFGKVFGPEAQNYIHVHHLRPLSEIGSEYVVNPIEDLRPVCPNCHAVLHLGGKCRTIEEVRALLKRNRPE